MASALKNLSSNQLEKVENADKMSIGIVVAAYHGEITGALYEGCYQTLLDKGVKADHIYTIQVPGAFELPAGAKILAANTRLDAVICLGCVIKGETAHNDYINQAVANGLTNLSIVSGKAFIFGVLTPDDEQQAKDRAGGKYGNKGVEAAVTALQMAALKLQLSGAPKKIGF